MKSITLFSVLLVSAASLADEIKQTSEGWCSPNVTNVQGPVTIVCHGVPPQALKGMNEQLNLKVSELSTTKRALADKIREAENWAIRYHELEARLVKLEAREAAQGSQATRAQQARETLERGNLDRVAEILQAMEEENRKFQEQSKAMKLRQEKVKTMIETVR